MAETPMVPIRTDFPDLSTMLPPKKDEPAPVQNYKAEASEKTPEKKPAYFATAMKDLWSYILYDLLIPASKDALTGVVKNGVDMLVYGKTNNNAKKEEPSTYVSYNRYYDDCRDVYRSNRSSLRGNQNPADDPNFLKFASRNEALDCLENLRSVCRRDGQVSVAFVFEICEARCSHTAVNYGWYSLSDAEVVPFRDGFRIDFPQVRCIK